MLAQTDMSAEAKSNVPIASPIEAKSEWLVKFGFVTITGRIGQI